MPRPSLVRHAITIAAAVLTVFTATVPFGSSDSASDGQERTVRFGLRKAETPHLLITTFTSRPDAATDTRLSLVVEVTPKPKMHVYAPDQKDYIPVSLSLESGEGFRHHTPVFPKPHTYFFEPLQETQLVYSKAFRIVQDVTVLASAFRASGQLPDAALHIKGMLRYQACDDKVCYMPRTVPLEWTIRLAGRRP